MIFVFYEEILIREGDEDTFGALSIISGRKRLLIIDR